MNRHNKPKANFARPDTVEPVKMRRAVKADAKEVADLIDRLKKLNSEFDPLFGVVADSKERAEHYVLTSLESPRALFLVATQASKVIGMVRGEIRERLFYEPSSEGFITEMYVLPEHRRRQLGHDMLDRASKELVKMGAQIIVADLPSRNEIGVHFYTKRGFRRLVETFARLPQ